MSYEWDPEKALQNIRKHNVDFADAVAVFEDEQALSREDPKAIGEERYIAVGLDHLGRVLTVVYTFRGERIRIISARGATPGESSAYGR